MQPGQHVRKGEVIGIGDNTTAWVHASTSGIVDRIDHVFAADSAEPVMAVILNADGLDEWLERPAPGLPQTPEALVERALQMGIVGLGGAGFPTALKLADAQQPDLLLINGAECEPFLTCDDRLMRENAEALIEAADYVAALLGITATRFGIETNKPEAMATLRAAARQARTRVEICPLPERYPAGGQPLMIKSLSGRNLAPGSRPADIGVLALNVATLYALGRAVFQDEPLTSRVLTLTGDCERPGNVRVPVGYPVSELCAIAGASPTGRVDPRSVARLMGRAATGRQRLRQQDQQLPDFRRRALPAGCSPRQQLHSLHALRGCLPDVAAAAGPLRCRRAPGQDQPAGTAPGRLHRMRQLQQHLPKQYPAARTVPPKQDGGPRMSLIRHPIPQRLRTVMLLVVLCLLPGTVLYAWQFGVVVWLQVFWCVLFALGFEAALLRLRGHDVRKGLSDFSWLVLGLILARALPLMVPLWMIALASFAALALCKHASGGLGRNRLNPAMVGLGVVAICFYQQLYPAPSNHAPWTATLDAKAVLLQQLQLVPRLELDAFAGATQLAQNEFTHVTHNLSGFGYVAGGFAAGFAAGDPHRDSAGR
ncbi:electron transport complex protein RnfC [Pseudomonas putida S11]|nr:electron transport complex protein RnfC [Pseudomonas putida S11]